MYKGKWAVIGGDARMAYLTEMLAKAGADVSRHCAGELGLDKARLGGCDAVVLPVPATDGAGRIRTPLWEGEASAEAVLACLGGDSLVFAGMAGEGLLDCAARHGLKTVDYFAREELAVLNAIPTAEGAIAIALAKRPATLFGARVLITGMGRIAKMLLKLLVAFGAHVTVAARKPADRVWATCAGAEAIGFDALPDRADSFDMVFGTVPQLVITADVIARLRPDCLIIDLASKPGGVDFKAAEKAGIDTEWALALPGKVAPKSAAGAIYTAIENSLLEMGML